MKLQIAWNARLKLRADGDKLWAEAIIAEYGNIPMEWIWRGKSYACKLESGDVYEPITPA